MRRNYTKIVDYEYTWWMKPMTSAFGLSKVEYVSLPAEGRYFDQSRNCGACRVLTSVLLWFALTAFSVELLQDVTCEFHGHPECEYSSTERQEKWAAGDGRILHDVHIRSRSNLTSAYVHTASIPHGIFGPYKANCYKFVRDPVDGGCDAGAQVQVPVQKLNQSWRAGGCSLFQDHWEGAWCTRFNASMQGTFGDGNYTFTSIKLFWSKEASHGEIYKHEPGVELSWRIPVSVPQASSTSGAGFQVMYYSLRGDMAQKTEMLFLLHEDVTYTPTAYFFENIGLGHLWPPKREYELLLDSQFSRPAIALDTDRGKFAGQFYLRASQLKRIVTRIPIDTIGSVPSQIGGLTEFLITVGTVCFFLVCHKKEVCLEAGQYETVRVAKTVSPDELNAEA